MNNTLDVMIDHNDLFQRTCWNIEVIHIDKNSFRPQHPTSNRS